MQKHCPYEQHETTHMLVGLRDSKVAAWNLINRKFLVCANYMIFKQFLRSMFNCPILDRKEQLVAAALIWQLLLI